jgi:ubiquinone/menaquinone biosynthesis C-methylase UbiE
MWSGRVPRLPALPAVAEQSAAKRRRAIQTKAAAGGTRVARQEKGKPRSNLHLRLMAFAFKFRDLLRPPERLLKKARLEEGMHVVDYGCGPGSFAIPAAEIVGPQGRVFAVDIHPLALSSVKHKALRKGLANIETILVRGYDTGIKGSSIDRVLLIDTFTQIENREALLRELYRVLKGNGLLLLAREHMSMSQQKEIVMNSRLFKIVDSWQDGILLAREIG